jgi:transcriptional regulator with XRE-family HTH domain
MNDLGPVQGPPPAHLGAGDRQQPSPLSNVSKGPHARSRARALDDAAPAPGRSRPHARSRARALDDAAVRMRTFEPVQRVQTGARVRRQSPGDPSPEEQAFLAAGFGRRLKELRALAGLTQERASALAGMHRASLAHLERGTRRPTADSVRALVAVLTPPKRMANATANELRQLAGSSWRTSHKRRAPKRPRLTVRRAEWNLNETKRMESQMKRVAHTLGRPLTDKERQSVERDYAQAVADLERARALDEISNRLATIDPTVGELIEHQTATAKSPRTKGTNAR